MISMYRIIPLTFLWTLFAIFSASAEEKATELEPVPKIVDDFLKELLQDRAGANEIFSKYQAKNEYLFQHLLYAIHRKPSLINEPKIQTILGVELAQRKRLYSKFDEVFIEKGWLDVCTEFRYLEPSGTQSEILAVCYKILNRFGNWVIENNPDTIFFRYAKAEIPIIPGAAKTPRYVNEDFLKVSQNSRGKTQLMTCRTLEIDAPTLGTISVREGVSTSAKLDLRTQGMSGMLLAGCGFTFRGDMSGVYFCDGDIHLQGSSVHRSLIISSGDVYLPTENYGACLVFARGKITVTGNPPKRISLAGIESKNPSKLYAQGLDIETGKPLIGEEKIVATFPIEGIETRRGMKKDPPPWDFIPRFVELSDVEINDVEVLCAGVRIKKFGAKSPLLKQGVNEGDFITSMDDKPINSAEDLRRSIRTAFAKGYAFVQVRRNDKPLLLFVSFDDYLLSLKKK